MYILKQIPEDFIVKEIFNLNCLNKGKYTYFILKKNNIGTIEAVQIIARALNLREKEIGFAGNKDKIAVTEQTCSALRISKERLEKVKLKNISIRFLGFGNKPISLGEHDGNKFEIVIRNLKNFKIDESKFFPNYFDEQRFSKLNPKIGKLILTKKFETAVSLLNNNLVQKHLAEKPNDFIGALKKIPLRLLKVYINAYQSYLWNETLSEYLKQKGKVKKKLDYSLGKLVFIDKPEQFLSLEIPLIGFDTEFENTEIMMIVKELIKKENIVFSDFVLKQIPELSLEGSRRKAFVEIKELNIGQVENDDLNNDKNKIKLTFYLNKGSYATMAVKSLINEIV